LKIYDIIEDNFEIMEHIQETLPIQCETNLAEASSMEQNRPFVIDNENLCEYYMKLLPDEIEGEVEMMKVASTKELFELIASDCQKYVSIIEYYKKENLQTLFNVVIHRIEGHLLIKFKFNAIDRWIEVGFFDDNNTDKETLKELRRMIMYYLKNYDEIGKQRRNHIASQLDQGDFHEIPINKEKKALPDNYFNSIDNPELQISERQKNSAGYVRTPAYLKDQIERGKGSSATITSHRTGGYDPMIFDCAEENAEVMQKLETLGKIVGIGESKDRRSFKELSRNINSQQYLIDVFKNAYNLLESLPSEQKVYVYQFLSEVVGRQSEQTMITLVMDLIKRADDHSKN